VGWASICCTTLKVMLGVAPMATASTTVEAMTAAAAAAAALLRAMVMVVLGSAPR
jgi:hypothetical protein